MIKSAVYFAALSSCYSASSALDPSSGYFENHFYEVVTDKRTYEEAQAIASLTEECDATGFLASVGSKEENDFIQSLLGGRQAFIGFDDLASEGEFLWLSGEPVTFQGWADGEPNDFSVGEGCASMMPNGQWQDVNCTKEYPYVVEYDCPSGRALQTVDDVTDVRDYGEHTYYFFSTKRTYNEATNFAKTLSACGKQGHLAVIDSEEENGFVNELALRSRPWIGYDDIGHEGRFEWNTVGEKSNYLNWNPGEPNDYGSGEDCTELRENDGWNDNPCSNKATYVVEFDCPAAAVVGEFGGHTYYYYSTTRTYSEATNFAKTLSACGKQGHLVVIDSKEENDFVNELALRSKPWIGYDDIGHEGTFEWNTVGEKSSYENWNPGEPNNYGSGEDCTELRENGGWNDIRCANRRNYVVEFDCPGEPDAEGDFGGHTYYYYSTKRTYSEATNFAKTLSACGKQGHLAVIDSKEENDFVNDLAQRSRPFIGYDDIGHEGTFTWNTVGEKSSYENWNPGEPNNYGSGEDCAEIRADGGWNDSPCSYTTTYVVEFDCPEVSATDERFICKVSKLQIHKTNADFGTTEEWNVNNGGMLYLGPGSLSKVGGPRVFDQFWRLNGGSNEFSVCRAREQSTSPQFCSFNYNFDSDGANWCVDADTPSFQYGFQFQVGDFGGVTFDNGPTIALQRKTIPTSTLTREVGEIDEIFSAIKTGPEGRQASVVIECGREAGNCAEAGFDDYLQRKNPDTPPCNGYFVMEDREVKASFDDGSLEQAINYLNDNYSSNPGSGPLRGIIQVRNRVAQDPRNVKNLSGSGKQSQDPSRSGFHRSLGSIADQFNMMHDAIAQGCPNANDRYICRVGQLDVLKTKDAGYFLNKETWRPRVGEIYSGSGTLSKFGAKTEGTFDLPNCKPRDKRTFQIGQKTCDFLYQGSESNADLCVDVGTSSFQYGYNFQVGDYDITMKFFGLKVNYKFDNGPYWSNVMKTVSTDELPEFYGDVWEHGVTRTGPEGRRGRITTKCWRERGTCFDAGFISPSDVGYTDPSNIRSDYDYQEDPPLHEVSFLTAHNSMSLAENTEPCFYNQHFGMKPLIQDHKTYGHMIELVLIDNKFFLTRKLNLVGKFVDKMKTDIVAALDEDPELVLWIDIRLDNDYHRDNAITTNQLKAALQEEIASIDGLNNRIFNKDNWKNTHQDWPTLGELIDADERVIMVVDLNGCEGTYGSGFLMGRTRITMESDRDTTNPSLCTGRDYNSPFITNWGGIGTWTRLFQMNHFIEDTCTSTDAVDGAWSSLYGHISTCTEKAGRKPNIVAVDWIGKQGNEVEIVEGMNRGFIFVYDALECNGEIMGNLPLPWLPNRLAAAKATEWTIPDNSARSLKFTGPLQAGVRIHIGSNLNRFGAGDSAVVTLKQDLAPEDEICIMNFDEKYNNVQFESYNAYKKGLANSIDGSRVSRFGVEYADTTNIEFYTEVTPNLHWTSRFNEAFTGLSEQNYGSPITGISCTSGSCDEIAILQASKRSACNSGVFAWSPWKTVNAISPNSCAPDEYVGRIQCHGSECAMFRVNCIKASSSCSLEPQDKKEVSTSVLEQMCDPGSIMTGMRKLPGRRVYMFCSKVTYTSQSIM